MKQEMDHNAHGMGGDGVEYEAMDAVLDELPEEDASCCILDDAACRVLIMLD